VFKLKYKKYIQLFSIALFTAFIIAGIMREEVFDVISNATILCFSCIGLK